MRADLAFHAGPVWAKKRAGCGVDERYIRVGDPERLFDKSTTSQDGAWDMRVQSESKDMMKERRLSQWTSTQIRIWIWVDEHSIVVRGVDVLGKWSFGLG